MVRVREERLRANLTQEELSAKIGISVHTISAWENGKQMPSASVALQLRDIFGCSVDYLLGLVDERS